MQLKNKLLAQTEEKLESNLLPEYRKNYQKVVVAGMKAALAKGPDGLLASIKKSSDPINDAAKGAVALVMLLFKQSRGTMPTQAMVPAAMTLMLHALDFAEMAGVVKIDADALHQATKTFSDAIFKASHITPQMLRKGHEAVAQVSKDPNNVEAMKRKAGIVRSPHASSPTEIPGEGGMINGV